MFRLYAFQVMLFNFPTGTTMGPDNNLYVSQWGFGKPPGGGEVVKVTLQ